MDKLLIIGASGHGKVIADIALATKKYREITFADDDENISECMGFPVIGKVSDLKRWMPEYEMIVAIGNAQTRLFFATPKYLMNAQQLTNSFL